MFEYGASIALKRPLGYDDAVEDKSFRMLVYGDSEKVDGQTYEVGVRGGLKFNSFKVQSWFYTGKLIDDEDWSNYRVCNTSSNICTHYIWNCCCNSNIRIITKCTSSNHANN